MEKSKISSVEYEEVELAEYLAVLIKKRFQILGILIGAVIIAVIFSFLTPRIYEINTSIKIGKTSLGFIEDPREVSDKIKSGVYKSLARQRLGIKGEECYKITTDIFRDSGLVIITAESKEPERTKIVLEEINNLILEEHQEKINIEQAVLEKRIEVLKKQLNSKEEQKKNLEEKTKLLEGINIYERTLANQFILLQSKEELETSKQEIWDFSFHIESLEKNIETFQLTEVMESPVISAKSIKPNIKLNVIIAGIAGLFLGVCWAFTSQWWETNKSKLKT